MEYVLDYTFEKIDPACAMQLIHCVSVFAANYLHGSEKVEIYIV